jgi:hypothetical protein
MMNGWWMWWMVVMLVLLVPSTGYGWGYRGWGPPYPSFIQRRRHARALAAGDPVGVDHRAWGWGGDIVWVSFLICAVWFVTALCWPFPMR